MATMSGRYTREIGTRVPSGAVAHRRSVTYCSELKPPRTGSTFFTDLEARV